jgi:hypothetical protein
MKSSVPVLNPCLMGVGLILSDVRQYSELGMAGQSGLTARAAHRIFVSGLPCPVSRRFMAPFTSICALFGSLPGRAHQPLRTLQRFLMPGIRVLSSGLRHTHFVVAGLPLPLWLSKSSVIRWIINAFSRKVHRWINAKAILSTGRAFKSNDFKASVVIF